MKRPSSALLYAGAAVLFWSTVATAFKIALEEIDFFHLLLRACLWSALALLATILIKKKGKALFSLSKRDVGAAAVLGLLNPTAYYLVLFRSYELLPAQIAQPLNYTWPIMLVLLSMPLLRQPPRWKDAVSFGLCFMGILLISRGGSALGGTRFSPAGIALAISSSLLWALYWVLNHRMSGDPEIRMFLSFTLALPVLLLIKLLFFPGSPGWTLRGLLSSVYVGLFEMGITFVFWSLAMKRAARSAEIGNLVYLSPFLSLLWIRLILGERIYLTTLAGLVTIVAGILVGQLKGRQGKS